MNSKTLGIVIKRFDMGEADRLLTIFTERYGKVKAMAKGVRRISAKMAGSLEPFMLVELMLYEGKTFYTVTGAAIVEDFAKLHQDINKMAQAFYVGELVDKFEHDRQKSPQVFSLFVDGLRAIESSEKSFVSHILAVKLLKTAGFWPDLSECLHCKEKIAPTQNYWDGNEGGLICENCQAKFHQGRPVSNDLIKIFRLIETSTFDSILRIKIPESLEEEIDSVLSIYIRSILESDLRSERFLHSH